MGDTNLVDLLLGVFWVARDFAIAAAVIFSVLGLVDRKMRGNAAAAWLVGLLGLIAGLATEDYATGYLNLTDGLAMAGLLVAALVFLITPRLRGAAWAYVQ